MNQIEYNIILKKNTNWAVVFFLVPFCVISIIGALVFTAGQIGSYFLDDKAMFPHQIFGFWILAGLLWILAFFTFKLIFWQILGQESIQFRENGVELVKSSRLFKSSEFIRYSEIKRFAQFDDKEPFDWINFWGLGAGKLLIKKSITEVHFGLDISTKKASSLVKRLNEELIKRQV